MSRVSSTVKSTKRYSVRKPLDRSTVDGLPSRDKLVLFWNGVTDTIGESSILYQSGDASTWQTTAVWGFERTAATIAIDTALGGGILFVGETPKYMTWAQWMIVAQINVNYLFIGIKGVVGYDTDQALSATKIRRYLNSVDEELLISDIFNGLDLNGYTISNSPVVPDQAGALRITAAGNLAVSGGLFVEASSTWAEKTPAPTKKTIRTLTGSKVIYADADPTAWRRAAISPTRTNKCTCRKINPVDTTNISKGGAAAATLAVVDYAAALATAGLDKICTSGKVYKLDNSAGTGAASVSIGGQCGNTNPHSLSIWVAGSGTYRFGHSGAAGSYGAIPANLTAVVRENQTVDNVVRQAYLEIAQGSLVYFILPQLAEGAFCVGPIIAAADPLASVTSTGAAMSKSTTGLLPMVSATEAQNFGIYARFNLKAAGQVAKLLACYTDANNCTCLDVTATTVVFNKRLAGTDIPVNRALTHAANAPIDVLAIQTDMGMSIKVRSYSGGSWSAWSAWTDDETASGKLAAKIAATLELGAANSASHMYGNVPLESILRLGNRTTLAEYQAVAEAEVNKINA